MGIAVAKSREEISVQDQQKLAIEGVNLSLADIAISNAVLAEKEAEARQRAEVAQRRAQEEIEKAQYSLESERLRAADIARETDWSKPDRPKIDGSYVKPRRFLAWVATSAARSRLEVLFIEQKSLRDQLTEILQEAEDYTWTEDGLANFSIKITRKGAGLETSYSILPKVRKVPDKIVSSWEKEKDTIWLPNFFEGKDPFEGKQVDAKGIPAGGTDKRGAFVKPTTKTTTQTDNNEF